MVELKDFPDLATQSDAIQELLNQPLLEGDNWYVVDANWLRNLYRFIGLSPSERPHLVTNPGPVDVSSLLDPQRPGELKPDLVSGQDYLLIPATVWEQVTLWYGFKEDQDPIKREVINVGKPKKTDLKIQVYKTYLNLYNKPDSDNYVVRAFSYIDKIAKIETACRTAFDVPDTQPIQLRVFPSNELPRILRREATVYEESLDSDLKVVMEFITPEEAQEMERTSFHKPVLSKSEKIVNNPKIVVKVPKAAINIPKAESSRSCGPVASRYTRYGSQMDGYGPPCVPGLSGLINLGNTCFLNSTTQCLSNISTVTKYFLKEHDNINVGMAKAYADLLDNMWSGKFSTTTPYFFKAQLSMIAPQFAGFKQHDAQELLVFLLDGLHEELNRVKDMPSYHQAEELNLPDEELAELTWNNFKRRNDSIIIDQFHGMLRSRVVCPSCEKTSTKFDTFATLSLPLPFSRERRLTVRFVPYEQSQSVIDLTILVPKIGSVRNIIKELSRLTGVKSDYIVLAEVHKSHFHRFLHNDDFIEQIGDRDSLYMYDLPAEKMKDHKVQYTVVPVVLWETQESRSRSPVTNTFGTPFLILLPQGPMYFKELYDIICERLTRSCPAFMKGNSTYGCFSMDFESADAGQQSGGNYLFTPVLVNIASSYEDITKFPENEQDKIEVPANYGRYLMALQINRHVRLKHYLDPTPIRHDKYDTLRYNSKPTLEDCLNLFTTAEKLGENNAWNCPNCKMKKRATKKLDLWTLPNIMVIHLKRFVFDEILRQKLETKVEFPITGLDINDYIVSPHKKNFLYDLVGICNHYGSLSGGHYTAVCKSSQDGNWYCFDDSSVSQICSDTIQTNNAYILFYQRRPAPMDNSTTDKTDL